MQTKQKMEIYNIGNQDLIKKNEKKETPIKLRRTLVMKKCIISNLLKTILNKIEIISIPIKIKPIIIYFESTNEENNKE